MLGIFRSEVDVALIVGDLLLGCGLEISGLLGALPEDLHGLHYILRLVVVSVAEVGGPVEVVVEHVEHVGKCGERLDARIPTGLRVGAGSDLIGRAVALRLHLMEPLVGDGDLCRISRGRENLRKQGIRIESDGREELLDLLGAERLRRCVALRNEVSLLIVWGSSVRLIGLWLLRVRLLRSGILRLLILLLRVWLLIAVLRSGLRVLIWVSTVRRLRIARLRGEMCGQASEYEECNQRGGRGLCDTQNGKAAMRRRFS